MYHNAISNTVRSSGLWGSGTPVATAAALRCRPRAHSRSWEELRYGEISARLAVKIRCFYPWSCDHSSTLSRRRVGITEPAPQTHGTN